MEQIKNSPLREAVGLGSENIITTVFVWVIVLDPNKVIDIRRWSVSVYMHIFIYVFFSKTQSKNLALAL